MNKEHEIIYNVFLQYLLEFTTTKCFHSYVLILALLFPKALQYKTQEKYKYLIEKN